MVSGDFPDKSSVSRVLRTWDKNLDGIAQKGVGAFWRCIAGTWRDLHENETDSQRKNSLRNFYTGGIEFWQKRKNIVKSWKSWHGRLKKTIDSDDPHLVRKENSEWEKKFSILSYLKKHT